MRIGKWTINGLCKECGWTGSWRDIKREIGKNQYEFVIRCPSCDRIGVIILYEDNIRDAK